jgi:hypothetical protein
VAAVPIVSQTKLKKKKSYYAGVGQQQFNQRTDQSLKAILENIYVYKEQQTNCVEQNP